MAHITFIHGIENKPPRDELLDRWHAALSVDGGIDLAAAGVSSTMVYWADVLYAEPLSDSADAIEPPLVFDGRVAHDIADAAVTADESEFLLRLAGKFSVARLKTMASLSLETSSSAIAEDRIPLPPFAIEYLMGILLRDVHHYLFNTRYSPRPGVEYLVRDEIRRRFIDGVSSAATSSGPHIVVSHSMGTVIAYDCLLRAAGCPKVDALLTIGSPLGLDEIQDQMHPEWTRNNGFPGDRLSTWVNVFDPLDPVAGFDPYIANDFLKNGSRVVVDLSESNWGWWRHDIAKYLAGPNLRAALRSLLGLPTDDAALSRSRRGVATVDSLRREGLSAPGTSQQVLTRAPGSLADVEDWLNTNRSPRRQISDSISDATGGSAAIHQITNRVDASSKLRAKFAGAIADAVVQIRCDADTDQPAVMTSPQNKVASLLQSYLAGARRDRIVAAEADMPFDKQDTQAMLKKVFKMAKKIPKHPAPPPPSTAPGPIPDNARVFLVSDFGTGLYGAPIIKQSAIAQGNFDLMLHLGDIYYSGMPNEVRLHFLPYWPMQAGAVSRTLNGNHDMYSGGYGYFDVALPALSQESSYFAFQNRNWLLIALDTAYHDNDLGKRQRKWLDRVLNRAGDRRVILFSHHPLFSNFKDQGTQIALRLHKHLKSGRIAAWYWGHEHHAVVYGAHPDYGLRARCLGNGGMPSKRKQLKDFPIERQIGDFCWRRGPDAVTPSCLYLDGPNRFIPDDPDRYGPHGYMTLEFDQSVLTETVYSAEGLPLFTNEIS